MTTTNCAKTAAELRQALKAAFPGVKFSVTSKTYTGGSSIRVCWKDGPKTDAVQAITSPMEGADFDGMQDLKTYRHNGSGADFIFTERSASEFANAAIAVRFREVFGFGLDEMVHGWGDTACYRIFAKCYGPKGLDGVSDFDFANAGGVNTRTRMCH